MYGKVKWYNKQRCYGFILGEDGKEYFVHQSEVKTISGELPQDYQVVFEPICNNNRLSAKQVHLA